MYETLSETDFNFSNNDSFRPNFYVNISAYMDQKIDIIKIYDGEIKKFPFPRSLKSIKSLASLRGSQSGFEFAEAFQLIYERNK